MYAIISFAFQSLFDVPIDGEVPQLHIPEGQPSTCQIEDSFINLSSAITSDPSPIDNEPFSSSILTSSLIIEPSATYVNPSSSISQPLTSSTASSPINPFAPSPISSTNVSQTSAKVKDGRKRKKTKETDADMVLKRALDELNSNPPGPYASFGSCVASELQGMEKKQAIIAKKVINDVMTLGSLGLLSESLIKDNPIMK